MITGIIVIIMINDGYRGGNDDHHNVGNDVVYDTVDD